MIITKKTKMRAFDTLQHILDVSNVDLQKEIKEFPIPKKIGLIAVADIGDIPIKHIFDIWDCSDNNELLKTTTAVFLKNTFWKKIIYKIQFFNEKRLPLVDFTRLVIYASEVSELSAKKFKSCKVLSTDKRIDDIVSKYQGDKMDMIIKFCKLFPAYTVKTAMEVGWHDIYLAFKSETKDTNIQIEISKLEHK